MALIFVAIVGLASCSENAEKLREMQETIDAQQIILEEYQRANDELAKMNDAYFEILAELHAYEEFFQRIENRLSTVTGSFRYPSEGIPGSAKMEMENLVTGEIFVTPYSYADRPLPENTFSFRVPMGFYVCSIFATDDGPRFPIYENILVLPDQNIDLNREYSAF